MEKKEGQKRTRKRVAVKKAGTKGTSKKTPKKTITLRLGSLSLILIGITVLLSAWGTINLLKINENLDKRDNVYDNILQYADKVDDKVDELKEFAIPARISIVSIVDSPCSDCSSIGPLIDQVKKDHVNVTSEKTLEYNSRNAVDLIRRYRIDLIPTVIVSSEEFHKTSLKEQWKDLGTVETDGSLVLRTLNPPYRSISQEKVIGRVTLTLLKDSSCSNCLNLTPFINQLRASGVSIVNETEIEYSIKEGKTLTDEYNITKIPSIILSGDVSEYSNIRTLWATIGSVEEDGSYILRTIDPPYMDLTERRVVGLVSLINLVDGSCPECYNVSIHKSIVSGYGLVLIDESTYDVQSDEGKALVAKYNITLVPTIILTGDPDAYSSLKPIWSQVGSVESDKTYVFRRPGAMRGVKYKDLTTGTVLG